ncbi:MAG TPA: N-acetylmuramoyl-L-alanine amidase [Candidatus Eisenbergiella merdipullorum]|uniref:N-acetylmuramoyl-L-alanine amidase n=1 Tax=Candidatus Eisenbergiella merdipullorum TaxID=2838553 RepID=A0A9D2I5N4_9FIRM|nr:N-acetylmuramoyl-L-alanine amidase [Candidatus Eisenbergiella merdipullorum]
MRTELKEGLLKGMVTVLLLTSVFWAAGQAAVLVNEGDAKEQDGSLCVVIDAGHGGIDPGKEGINGELEKDLNLQIAQKLRMFLEASDVRVVMTRTTDMGLYDENASNKKVQDMKQRIQIIEEAQPDIVVSIHQNSYGEEYVKGAQVFYYKGSAQGKAAAELIQSRLIEKLDPENHRSARANDSYYLLKKTGRPIVIVECGFLSNREEAGKLSDDYYQEKLAWHIHMALMQYLNGVRETAEAQETTGTGDNGVLS